MSHVLCAKQAALPAGSSGSPSLASVSQTIDRRCRHRVALFASCVFIAGALLLSAAPAMAGCNSGKDANTYLLSSVICQADASGTQSTAVGIAAAATGIAGSAFGNNSAALGQIATAVGSFANALGSRATAVGGFSGARVAVTGATTVGAQAGFDGAGFF